VTVCPVCPDVGTTAGTDEQIGAPEMQLDSVSGVQLNLFFTSSDVRGGTGS